MKKILVIMLGVTSLCACKKESGESRFTARVDVSTIVRGMKNTDGADYFTASDKRPVTVSFLVYDERDALVYEAEETLEDFFRVASFSATLENGNYTVVAWACISDDGYSSDWEAEATERLSTLTLKVNFYPYDAPVLGVGRKSVSISRRFFDGDISEEIALEPVGAMYTLGFLYASSTRATEIYYMGDCDNVSYHVQSGTSEVKKDADNFLWDGRLDVNASVLGRSVAVFLLPMQQEIGWATVNYNNNGDPNILNMNTYVFQAEAGKHMIALTDTDTGKTTFTSLTRSDTPPLPENSLWPASAGKIRTPVLPKALLRK